MPKAKSIEWNAKEGPVANAKRELPALVVAYFAQGRETLAKNQKLADLHALRLQTKRMRYLLELFRPCYGPGLRERLASLRRIQQSLGELNDLVTAREVVAGLSRTSAPLSRRVDRFLQAKSLAQVEVFRREWTESFDAPGRERWWTGYLARHARQPARARSRS